MNKMLNDKLIHNYIIDLKKRDIDKFQRAILLKKYLKENKMAVKSFSLKFGISKNTIENWLMFDRLTSKQYDDMKKSGMEDSDICSVLRKGSLDMTLKTKTDYELDNAINKLRPCVYTTLPNSNTDERIRELMNIINRIKLHMERKIK